MEIELTEQQMKRVEELEAQGINVGKAIDMLYDVKDEAFSQMEKMGFLDRLRSNTMDADNKAKELDENYSEGEKTYEVQVQDVKHKVSWAKDFFKF